MSWIETFTNALNKSLKSKLDKKEAFVTFAKKTELFSRDYKDLKNKPNYAEVARTGSYNDLVDKIPYATVGASLYEDRLEYKDNLYNSTPINTSLPFVVKKEEDPGLGYGSSYYTIFRDSEGLVTLAMQPRNNMDYPYFPPSRTVHVNDPEGHSISRFSGFNVINGKLYIYEGDPNYGLFIADLNNKYIDDNVWKVDAEYISLPDSFYKESYGRPVKVQIDAVEYCDEYYYVNLNKSAYTTYTADDVIVYKTRDFITFTETPIKVGDPIRGTPAHNTLKMWGDKLVVMPDRSPAPFRVFDGEHDNWIEIPNMVDEPRYPGAIKYSLYNETLNIVTVFFDNTAYVCDASKLLDVDNFSWKKINDPVEYDFDSSISYIDHIVPDTYNRLHKPVSVIATYYRYYYSYDGYTWHAVEVNNYRNICFVNVTQGNFLIYALKANMESGLRYIRLSNGITIANTEYSGYTDVTSELALAIRNKIGFLEPPPFDDTYNLKCTVVDGVPAYTWEEAVTKLAQLTSDSTHRVVTDDEKSTWNGKSDVVISSVSNITPTQVATAISQGKTVVITAYHDAFGFLSFEAWNVATNLNLVISNTTARVLNRWATISLQGYLTNNTWEFASAFIARSEDLDDYALKTDLDDYAKTADVVAISQGTAHANEFLVVGADGNVTTQSLPLYDGSVV